MKIQIGLRFLPVSPVVIGGRSGFLFIEHLTRVRSKSAVVFHSRTHSEVAADLGRPRFFVCRRQTATGRTARFALNILSLNILSRELFCCDSQPKRGPPQIWRLQLLLEPKLGFAEFALAMRLT
jgi:hypothetical protein